MSRTNTLVVLAVLVSACGDAPTRPRPRGPDDLPPLGPFITGIDMPTYEQSGQTVHPDYAAPPSWWPENAPGYLAITPYPDGDAHKENPSLFEGSFDRWNVPDGAPNPVRFPGAGYFSDPDALFNPDTRELWMYVRRVSGANTIRLLRTPNARAWTEPVTVVEGPEHTIVSPAVVRRAAGDWLMWSINSGSVGCGASKTSVELRRSSDGIAWSEPQKLDFPLPPSGLMPWHIDVQWIEKLGEYWAIFNAKDARNCGTTAIYISTSKDGVAWTTEPRPILVAGEVEELQDIVYRTTFSYDASTDVVTLWYSGASKHPGEMIWRTVMQRVERAVLFGRASLMSRAASASAIPASVPLLDPP